MIAAASAPVLADPEPNPAPPPPAVELSGYTQIDAVAWDEDSVDQLDADGAIRNEERLVVRRARLRAEGRRGDLHGALELDGNTVAGATARILAAEVGWARTFRAEVTTGVSAGLMKIPFGIDVPTSDRRRDLLEPSTASRALFPGNYDLGARADLAWRYLRVTAAAMNGAPVADAQYRGRDPSESYDLVGRAGAVVDGCGWEIAAGASVLLGEGLHPGTPPTKDDLAWVDANEDGIVQTTELQVIDGDPGTPAVGFDRQAFGADASVRWWARGLGWGQAFAELAVATNLDRGLVAADPIAAGRDLRELGWQIGAVQSLGPHVVVGARHDRYRPDRDAAETQGVDRVRVDPRWATTAAFVSVRHRGGRLTLQYDHEDNPLGRADDGTPTTRAADRVVLRGQWEL